MPSVSGLGGGSGSTCRQLSAPHKLWRAAVRAAGPALVLAHMSAAGAASAAVFPQRVKTILAHLQQHPMKVSSLAMQYDADPTTPLPACLQGLTPADVVSRSSDASCHMARVIAGLLYAACGGLDHAHNLITPLCWGSWTPYAGQCDKVCKQIRTASLGMHFATKQMLSCTKSGCADTHKSLSGQMHKEGPALLGAAAAVPGVKPPVLCNVLPPSLPSPLLLLPGC